MSKSRHTEAQMVAAIKCGVRKACVSVRRLREGFPVFGYLEVFVRSQHHGGINRQALHRTVPSTPSANWPALCASVPTIRPSEA